MPGPGQLLDQQNEALVKFYNPSEAIETIEVIEDDYENDENQQHPLIGTRVKAEDKDIGFVVDVQPSQDKYGMDISIKLYDEDLIERYVGCMPTSFSTRSTMDPVDTPNTPDTDVDLQRYRRFPRESFMMEAPKLDDAMMHMAHVAINASKHLNKVKFPNMPEPQEHPKDNIHNELRMNWHNALRSLTEPETLKWNIFSSLPRFKDCMKDLEYHHDIVDKAGRRQYGNNIFKVCGPNYFIGTYKSILEEYDFDFDKIIPYLHKQGLRMPNTEDKLFGTYVRRNLIIKQEFKKQNIKLSPEIFF